MFDITVFGATGTVSWVPVRGVVPAGIDKTIFLQGIPVKESLQKLFCVDLMGA